MAILTGTIQLRRDTAANWTTNDPTLLAGEWGYETDTGKWKAGDGSTAWTSLAYFGVTGPSSATDRQVAVFDATTGKLITNSSATISGAGVLAVAAGITAASVTTTGNVSAGGNLTGVNVVVTGTVDGRDVAADGTKLDGIEAGATADQSDAEIETAYNNQVGIVSQVDAEAGTSTTAERWTPQRVAQAIAALASGGDTTNNYSSISAPQLFNPDAGGVSGNTDDFTLSSSNAVALVTVNGQVLDDSEYSLVASTLTVTPDNGFEDTSDEVLVFQHSFATVTGGLTTAFTSKSATYTILSTDHTINCTANTFTLTLPTAASIAGKQYVIKNSGTGTITVDGDGSETIDGSTTATISTQYESITVQSDGTNWIII